MRIVRLDGSRIASKSEFLDAVSAALSFPDYFGCNWDALDECLGDVDEPATVEWSDAARFAEADPVGYEVALRCFSETSGPVTLRVV